MPARASTVGVSTEPVVPRPRLTVAAIVATTALWAAPAAALDGATPLEITAQPIPGDEWRVLELYTSGDAIGGIADPGYTQKARFDGMGAYAHDADTVRVFFNHEQAAASISYFDLNRARLQNWLATGSSAAPSPVVSRIGQAFTSISGDATLTSLCSSSLLEPNRFGAGRGLAGRAYVTGEEVAGGSIYAMDADPGSPTFRTLFQCTGLPSGAWENAIEFDTGRTDKVGLMLLEDAGSDTVTGTAPLRIWIGNKNPAGAFLERNGLASGTTYYWVPQGTGTSAPQRFTATDQAVAGTWSSNPSGAMLFSKLEDGHLSPSSGTLAAFASQDQGVFTASLSLAFDAGGNLTSGSGATVRLLLEEANDGGPTAGFNSLDNMVWSADPLLFVQEDGSSQDIWQIDPSSGNLTRDGIVIARATGGAAESSGVIDISSLLGYVPGSVLLANSHSNTAADNQVVVLFSPNAALVPEPGAAGLAALAALAVGARPARGRRQRSGWGGAA